MRVIIVEDEMKIRTGMARLISAHTVHEVVGEAKNGKEGLELIQKLHPDLVISDIRMPVMDGLEMLAEMRKAGIFTFCVVLSGFSEFEYAQKAIEYGVEAYLLKPLAPEDVIQMLDGIQKKLDERQEKQGETKEGLLRSILSGKHAGSEKEIELFRKAGDYHQDLPCYLLAVYIGDADAAYADVVYSLFEKCCFREKGGRGDWVLLEDAQQIFCLLQGDFTEEELCKEIDRGAYRMLPEEEHPCWALCEMSDWLAFSEKKEELLKLQEYGVRLGYRRVLRACDTEQCESMEYVYPKQFEALLRSELCKGNGEKLEEVTERIINEIRKMTWEPRRFKRTYRKLIQFVGSVLQETDSAAGKAVEELELENLTAKAVTLGELERIFQKMIETILASKDKKEDIRNYTILRAINYIKEHYRENISLDQMAEYLEMTPEYLSTLFNREMGINFTTFLKEFRISHAKRLLKGSSLKVYEIAAEVGYNDSKYFNRVFKEVTGVSPGDYRQQN